MNLRVRGTGTRAFRIGVALLASLFPLPFSLFPLSCSAQDAPPTAEEKQFVALVNRDRAKEGLSALAIDPALTRMARGLSRDMRTRNFFSHTSPVAGKRTMEERFALASPDRRWTALAENIYMARGRFSVEKAHQQWMNSPGHRANILNAQVRAIGVGIEKDPKTRQVWVTEDFARYDQR